MSIYGGGAVYIAKCEIVQVDPSNIACEMEGSFIRNISQFLHGQFIL